MSFKIEGINEVENQLRSNSEIDRESQNSQKVLRAASIYRNRSRLSTFSAVEPDNAPSCLAWENLTVTATVNNSNKVLLNNIKGTIGGGFWAIMGPSGGGKTTLLSTLALRIDPSKMKVIGDITLNGKPYNIKTLKAMAAYVMQDDLLHPDLTVAETLDFTAKLRLSEKVPPEERAERIQEVIDLVGIDHCKQVIVGDTRKKGISGGERKRLCIAMELLNNPSLLFLDEPTSGLDSTTALSVCQALKRLSDLGVCTVVCTIHQPQSKIFDLFDNMILMKKGNIVYQGSAQKSIKFLDSIGIQCPPGSNPADFLIDLISKTDDSTAVDTLSQSTSRLEIDLHIGENKPSFQAREIKNWCSQVYILFTRNVQQTLRRKDILIINVIVTVFLAIFVSCGVWQNIGTTQKSIDTRAPSLFFASVTQGIIASLQATNSFPLERALSLRERAAGTYYVSAYFFAKSLGDTLFQIISPIIFSIIVYPVIGYQNKADKFFIYMLFMILDTIAATSLATMLSTICVSIELTTVVMSVAFEMSRLYGGYFISPAQMEEFPEWKFADALSYIKYAYVGISINELDGLELSCTPQEVAANKCISTGEEYSEIKGYDEYTIPFCVGILLVMIFSYRIIGYLALRYIKN